MVGESIACIVPIDLYLSHHVMLSISTGKNVIIATRDPEAVAMGISLVIGLL